MHDNRRAARPATAVWGIVGGLGPLASAQFVSTVYARSRGPDQEHPHLILLSDPAFPDRTECLLRHEPEPLIERLQTSLDSLVACGATRLVVCCVTIHAVLPALVPALRRRMLSLVDLIVEQLSAVDVPHLMLASTGCRAAGVFEAHPRWPRVRDRVLWPEPADQEKVHALIYALKQGAGEAGHVQQVCGLLEQYGVSKYIAGCTELHLLTTVLESVAGGSHRDMCIDPLVLAADVIADTTSPAAREAAATTGLAS